MKKLISIFVSCMILILVGCAGGASGHKGEAKTPSGSSVQKGRDYQEVVSQFKDKGFKNIKTEKKEDLITGWLTKDGEVESFSFDGDQDYSSDVWYSNDVEIVITYHTFPEEEVSDTGTPGEKNSEKEDQITEEKDKPAESEQ